MSTVSHLPEKPEHVKYHTEYGSWISENSAPRIFEAVKELVEGQSPVSMHDLVGATGFTEGTVAKALLRLGYLRINDGTVYSLSSWGKVSDRMPEGLTFRPYRDPKPEAVDDHTAAQPEEPTAAPEDQPEAVGAFVWLTRDVDPALTIEQFGRMLAALGFEYRIQVRPRA